MVMSNREMLNAALKRNGFAGEEDPRALLDQIAVHIEDHDDFRRLLWKTEPEQRTNAYYALASRLRFKPLPLDDYLMQSRNWASERYSHSATGKPLEMVAEQAINRADMQGIKGVLTVVCVRCTTEAKFPGATQVDAVIAARNAGWVYDGVNDKEICPKCAAAKDKVN